MRKMSKEQQRLQQPTEGFVPPWQKWGPYVAERSWGTVREDYSWNGDAWDYFPFEKARSKVYRWGEDGIAGFCDRYQVLLFAPAFWNGKDPILKERLFGLNSSEGNHGEDVKESYFYLDATPSHSYMKYLYKYPHLEFPYERLIAENQKRTPLDPEFELIDTDIFAEHRYFDIFIEYAKASPEDICIKIEAINRGKEASALHLLPHLWFRNSWAWGDERLNEPLITCQTDQETLCLIADDTGLPSPAPLMFDYHLGQRYLYAPLGGEAIFTDNEDVQPLRKYYKEAFHRYLIEKDQEAIRPDGQGTKAAIDYFFKSIGPGEAVTLYFRLTDREMPAPLRDVEKIIQLRKKEADAFYETVHPPQATAEEKMIQRQALAGIIWSKQIYLFDVDLWLKGDNSYLPPPASRLKLRNHHWRHLNSMRVLLMPDKWEYPWFASWDLAFHCLSMALVDIEFAKEQLWLLLFDQFQHPNGQIPAFEWDFSDLNPPLQAFAALQLYQTEKALFGREDRSFLKKCLTKLLMNFAWWVNKVDSAGYNVFEGGFLGLDNISIVNRSEKLPDGMRLQQSDGTGWMGMYCLNLMRMALEIAREDESYEAIATKFFQHFVTIAHAMTIRDSQNYELWSESDGFFYDALSCQDGSYIKFPIRSIVGVIPLFAVEILDAAQMDQFPSFKRDFHWFLRHRAHLCSACIDVVEGEEGIKYVCSIPRKSRLEKILRYVWDSQEFRSSFGLRSLSKFHSSHPVTFQNWTIGYEPGESQAKIKGGNSNWRGPIWFPVNYMLYRSINCYFEAFQEMRVDSPGEASVSLKEMSLFFAKSLISLFKKNEKGERPYLGENFKFAQDPHWQDCLLFYEYFHAETGKGLGACHQTGWTALVANFIHESYLPSLRKRDD